VNFKATNYTSKSTPVSVAGPPNLGIIASLSKLYSSHSQTSYNLAYNHFFLFDLSCLLPNDKGIDFSFKLNSCSEGNAKRKYCSLSIIACSN